MEVREPLWVAGAYVAGTFPSTLIVAVASGVRGRALLKAAGWSAGETDPHILMPKYLGTLPAALAATLDVLKGLLVVLAARHWGHLSVEWLAFVGLAAVAGHAFPLYARRMSGRGLATAAGVLLVLLPVEMVVAGLLIVVGGLVRNSGLLSTIGLASVPFVAALQGQPGVLVSMGAGIVALVWLRRLVGVGDVIRGGVPPLRAIWYRLVYDSSGAPGGRA